MRMQQMEQALNSRTNVDAASGIQATQNAASTQRRASPTSRDEMLDEIAATRRRLTSSTAMDVTSAYQQKLAMLQGGQAASGAGGVGGMSTASGPVSLTAAQGVQTSNVAFMQEGQGTDKWDLGTGTPTAPRTPYEVRTGTIIPAILDSGINSDLPGTVIAHVSQNVYDTATGRHLVIPQGTKLIGSYNSNIVYGQERVLMAWQRLVYPDGTALDIGNMPGTDGAGYAGFADKVDHHYFRVFGSAILLSGVIAAVDISQNDKNSGETQRASDSLSESLGQVLGQAVAQMLQKNLNIAPTIEIRPGYRFNVIAVKDIPFTNPYRPFNY